MKKIFLIIGICFLAVFQSDAQSGVESTIQVFPFQKTTDATKALEKIGRAHV